MADEEEDVEVLDEEEEDEPDEETKFEQCRFMFRIHTSGESFNIAAQETWNVTRLKKEIEEIKQITFEQQQLVHEATVLSYDDSLVTLRKREGEAVELLLVNTEETPESAQVIDWIRYARKDWQKLCLEEFRSGTSLVKVPAWIWSDRRIIIAAMRSHPFILELADAKVKADREVVLSGVRIHRSVLKYCAGEIAADPKCLLAAIKIDALALEHAAATLRGDPKIVLEAITTKFQAFRFASDSLKRDKDFILAALQSKVDVGIVGYAHSSLLKDKDFVIAAVELDWKVLKIGNPALQPMLSQRDVLLAAVQQDGSALQYAAQELRSDAGVVVAAAAKDSTAIKQASPALLKNSNFMLALAERAPGAFQYLPEDLILSKVLTQEHFNRLPKLVPASTGKDHYDPKLRN
eukprot:TRINITY_DN64411_c0_g1_i1.p1 TRINITY_DN64411_c0_g1~~TRINITY_DN64411_c0_g1_i1.p1  ORF type:complete len:407 (-),score=100.66 TRINITY_DN64411_c0_g1_i1:115-1335(-)